MELHVKEKHNEDEEDAIGGNKNGVLLTWEELRVTVSNGKKSILEGLTGYALPAKVLAIIGPSGSGKSTLLDALAGRLSSNTKQAGRVLINSHKHRLAYGTSAYVTQEEMLIWTLTIRETVYYSAQLQLPNSMSKTQKTERAEKAIREMGLQDSVDTRIGGWGCKSLSGGQKRRLSICIEILTRPKLLFLDEPTSGLDSAASYYVMSRIVKLAEQERMTFIASIHQPSSEVFELFHSLCLLSLGRTVYFGSSHGANEDVEQGVRGTMTTQEVINLLVKSFKSSDTFNQIQSQVAAIHSQSRGAVEEKRSQASFCTQFLVLTWRSFTNISRDLGYYWLRFAIYIALGLGLGTVFYHIGSDYDSIRARGSMLMFIASFLTIMDVGGFPSFVEDMKVFGRERLNGHYGAAAFVIGSTLSSLPYLLIISLIPGAITYYLAGLHHGNEQFTYFILVLFVSMMLVESLMMIVASSVPNFLMGLIIGAGIQGLMMLSSGFFRLPNHLPKIFWRYPLYYIAFHKYAYQGLYKNEFAGLSFHNTQQLGVGGPSTIDGEEILRDTLQVERCVTPSGLILPSNLEW